MIANAIIAELSQRLAPASQSRERVRGLGAQPALKEAP